MYLKSIAYFTSILLSTTSVFADQIIEDNASNKYDLDILINAGYTKLSNFDNNVNLPSMNGFNLGVSFLKSFLNGTIAPVLGGGLNAIYVSGTKDISNNKDYNLELISLALLAQGGAKIKATGDLNIYYLINFGYGIINYTNLSPYNLDTTFKHKNYIGTSLIVTYNINQLLSLGAGVTYNKRYINASSDKNNFNITFRANEISANLIAGFNM